MGPAGAQLAADAHEEHHAVAVLGEVGGLPAAAVGQVGIQVLQLLGGDEAHIAGQVHRELREFDLQCLVGDVDGVGDGAHDALQEFRAALFAGDDLLPVPLVHIDRVEVVEGLVAADGVHIGDEAVAGEEVVALERVALPLGQGLHHLALRAHRGHVEAYGTLIAVEVVVQTGGFLHEKRGGDPLQIQGVAQISQEIVLDEFNGPLGLVDGQRIFVTLGDVAAVHDTPSFFGK